MKGYSFTRRNLLKSEFAATAGLINADSLFHLPNAEMAAMITQDHASLLSSGKDIFDPISSCERLLLNFGQHSNLGNADCAAQDFRFGPPTCEGNFSKAGQNWLHNQSPNEARFMACAWYLYNQPSEGSNTA